MREGALASFCYLVFALLYAARTVKLNPYAAVRKGRFVYFVEEKKLEASN